MRMIRECFKFNTGSKGRLVLVDVIRVTKEFK